MKCLSVLTIACCFVTQTVLADAPVAELIEVKKIWDDAPHSAFTDLVRWNDQFVCAFREGRGHVSADGTIRVLTSADGDAWQSAASIVLDGYDLRDAGLSITPQGRLMLIGGASPRPADGARAPTGTFVSLSDDAKSWTTPEIVVEPGRWLWRVTWNGGKAYGVSYAAGTRDRATSLLVSDDGLKFNDLVPKLLDDSNPTEAALRFDDDGTLNCLQRRDGKPPANSAMLGVSEPPYTNWQWHDLGIFFGGPNFIEVPGGRWIAAGRIHTGAGPKTVVASLDVNAKTLTPILELPSGGDTSYPGLVWHDGALWVSYYSSHEANTSIYLAKMRIE
jgi:hypothetical protein